jgi:hypothetical protein
MHFSKTGSFYFAKTGNYHVAVTRFGFGREASPNP